MGIDNDRWEGLRPSQLPRAAEEPKVPNKSNQCPECGPIKVSGGTIATCSTQPTTTTPHDNRKERLF